MEHRSSQRIRDFVQPKQLLWKLTDAARHLRQKHLLNPDAALGRRGEDLAHRYLRQSGFHIMARNYRLQDGSGEIDIVARDGDLLVFIEVKSRRSTQYSSPERAIDPGKQQRMTRAARAYAAQVGASWNQVRFDVVAIVFTSPPALMHYEDDFFQGRTL